MQPNHNCKAIKTNTSKFKSAKKDENKDQKTRAESDFCRGQRLPEVTVLEGLDSLKASQGVHSTQKRKQNQQLSRRRFKNRNSNRVICTTYVVHTMYSHTYPCVIEDKSTSNPQNLKLISRPIVLLGMTSIQLHSPPPDTA